MSFMLRSILGFKQVISLEWLSQYDNTDGKGYRECQSSSSAMFCEYYKKGCLSGHALRRPGEQLDDLYVRLLAKYGDTTDPAAHTKLHRELGVNSKFRVNGTRETLEWHILHRFPVMVGQLHHDYYLHPNPAKSHWNLCVGWTPKEDSFVFHDPAGVMDAKNGGYLDSNGKYVCYPWEFWKHRWMADSAGNFEDGAGWCHVPVTDKVSGKYVPL